MDHCSWIVSCYTVSRSFFFLDFFFTRFCGRRWNGNARSFRTDHGDRRRTVGLDQADRPRLAAPDAAHALLLAGPRGPARPELGRLRQQSSAQHVAEAVRKHPRRHPRQR